MGLLALVPWCLYFARVAAGGLCLLAAPLLLLRRRATARVAAYALGGIGTAGLVVSSVLLWTGRELGVF